LFDRCSVGSHALLAPGDESTPSFLHEMSQEIL
jgi:hypothetical protein